MLNTLWQSIKNHALQLLSTVWLFLTPIMWPIFYLTILVLADMGFGLWRARKEKQPIRSNYLRRTVTKLVLYMAASILAYIAQYGVGMGFGIDLTRIVMSLISLVELRSILENISRISGQPIWDILIARLTGRSPKAQEREFFKKAKKRPKKGRGLKNAKVVRKDS